MTESPLQLLRQAANDRGKVVLEGAHAVKHALRFGAEMDLIATADPVQAEELLRGLAPDILEAALPLLTGVPPEVVEALGRPVPTGMVAIAARPARQIPDEGPVVALDHPRDLGNVGAVIRVAAATGVAGVLCTGELDPWHPAAIRGSAGLHFALPVATGEVNQLIDRALIGFDADGERLDPSSLPTNAALMFGSERSGLQRETRERCVKLVSLPMRAGVSSLNLATSVSAAVMSWRIATGWNPAAAR